MTQAARESDRPATRIRVLPETWAGRVSDFIRSSGTEEEAAAEARPELLYTRFYLPAEGAYYSDFNVRSRQLRCIENFFVESDEQDEIKAVVAIEAPRSDSRVLRVSLVVAHVGDGDPAQRLAHLLDGVLSVARQFTPADRLRFAYVYDTTAETTVGVRMAKVFHNLPPELPFREEARIPNETGQTREAVLLAFDGFERLDAPSSGDGAG
jgi:hypothetical protein